MSLTFECEGQELRVSQFICVIYARGGGKNIFFLHNEEENCYDRAMGDKKLFLRARFHAGERPEISMWRYGERQKYWERQRLVHYKKSGKREVHPVLESNPFEIDEEKGELRFLIHQQLFTAKHVWDNKYETGLQFKFEMRYSGLVVETPVFPVPQFRPEDSLPVNVRVRGGKKRAPGEYRLACHPAIAEPHAEWEDVLGASCGGGAAPLDPGFSQFVAEDDVKKELDAYNNPLRLLLNDYVGGIVGHMYESMSLVEGLHSLCTVRDCCAGGESSEPILEPQMHIVGPCRSGTEGFVEIGHVAAPSAPLPSCLVLDGAVGGLFLDFRKVEHASSIRLMRWDMLFQQEQILWSHQLEGDCSLLVLHELPNVLSMASVLVELSSQFGISDRRLFKLKAPSEWSVADFVEWLYLFAVEKGVMNQLFGTISEFASLAGPDDVVSFIMHAREYDVVALSTYMPGIPPYVLHDIATALNV